MSEGIHLREEPPAFGGSWRQLYAIVLANLVFWIAVMAVLTRVYE